MVSISIEKVFVFDIRMNTYIKETRRLELVGSDFRWVDGKKAMNIWFFVWWAMKKSRQLLEMMRWTDEVIHGKSEEEECSINHENTEVIVGRKMGEERGISYLIRLTTLHSPNCLFIPFPFQYYPRMLFASSSITSTAIACSAKRRSAARWVWRTWRVLWAKLDAVRLI